MFKIILILLVFVSFLPAGTQWTKVIDLRGQWKFNLGDDMSWAEADFDDRDWENIFVPAPWEDEGFPGYDGYAWYRVNFRIDKKYKDQILYLRLWQIDDVDEVYVNGDFIGFSGSFPPNYITSYASDRVYRIPNESLDFDEENVIAVRVYDSELGGGILRGRIGIYTREGEIEPDIPLDGSWKFMIGDNPEWKESDFGDWNWENIMVPAPWEIQGHKDYDGMAWYRKRVVIPGDYRNQKLILLLGKIDDLDEVYFNGSLVGKTGRIPESGYRSVEGNEWLAWRSYSLDSDLINYNTGNLIAVRVYDDRIHGGIYQGPVGIMTRDKFNKWRSNTGENKKGFFELLFSD
jgi:hypothetical protein